MVYRIEEVGQKDVYNLLIGLIAPRPIALVTSMDEHGRMNAAPYSSYNYLAIDPPVIGIGVANRAAGELAAKDTARNIRRQGEFVVNVVTEDLLHAMNVCGIDFPSEVDELEMAGLTTAPSAVVNVPRIAQAHAALECVELQTIEIGRSRIVLGRVVAMYVEDRFIDPAGPYVLAEELHLMGRMNGQGAYVRTEGAFVREPRVPYAEWQKSHGE